MPTLSCGTKVLVEEIHRSPVVAIQVWVQVGSGDERTGEAGLSHILEHMLFKGTQDGGTGDIARAVEGCGGEINAFTSFDQTVLHLVVPSRYLERGLDVAYDAVMRPALDAEEFGREKGVVLEEIHRGDDDPSMRLSKAVFAEIYRDHPYGRPVIGTADSVMALDIDTVRAYHRRWYAPSNITLVVVGDVDTQTVMDAVEARFGAHEHQAPPEQPRPVEPVQEALRSCSLVESVKEARVEVAFPLPAVDHPDIPVADVLALILGQGESSRLNQEIRIRRRLANHIQAFSYTPRDPGIFLLGLGCPPGDTLEAVEALGEVLRDVVAHGVNAEEVRRAVVNILSDRTYERETVEGVSRKLGYFDALFGDPDAEAGYYAGVAEVTPEVVRQFAERTFHPDRITLGLLTPRDQPTALEDVEARLLRGMEPPAVVGERSMAPETVRRELGNGVTLLLRENPGSGLVSLRLGMTGGLRFETMRNNGVHNLLARVWNRGTKRRNALQFAEAMDEIVGKCSAFAGRNSFGLSATFLASGQARGLDLFAEVLTEPSFPADEVERMKMLTLEAIRNIPDSPVSLGFQEFHKLLYKRHPFRMPSLGTARSVPRLTPGMLRAAYRRGLVGSNTVMTAVGDFDGAAMEERLTALMETLPGGPRPSPRLPDEPPLAGMREQEIGVEKEQAHLLVGFPGMTVDHPDRHALEMLSAILAGQSGRLFLDLRDKQSLAYSVTAWSQEAVDPGYFLVYIGTDPTKLERARTGILSHLDRLRAEPVAADEIDRAARYLVGSFEIGLQKGGSVASRILFDELYGMGHDTMDTYAERIFALGADELQRVAQDIFTLGDHVELALVPEK